MIKMDTENLNYMIEHSNIINENGILLDEDLNLCLNQEGEIQRVEEKDKHYFRVYNEKEGEFN